MLQELTSLQKVEASRPEGAATSFVHAMLVGSNGQVSISHLVFCLGWKLQYLITGRSSINVYSMLFQVWGAALGAVIRASAKGRQLRGRKCIDERKTVDRKRVGGDFGVGTESTIFPGAVVHGEEEMKCALQQGGSCQQEISATVAGEMEPQRALEVSGVNGENFEGGNPIYISIGHRISLPTAIEVHPPPPLPRQSSVFVNTFSLF